jgi:prepilin peptidase CpaA
MENLALIVRIVVCVLFLAVSIAASVSDIRFRRIPNWASLAVIALFIAWAFTGPVSIVSSLEAAAIVFAATLILYALRIFGAGDSKFLTAMALFAGMKHLLVMLMAMALFGGVLAIISLVSNPHRTMAMITLRGKGDWGRKVPYGVAIAVGGLYVVGTELACQLRVMDGLLCF